MHNVLLHVRFPWRRDIGALSRNNAMVHCYVYLATQQFKRRAYPQHCYARDNSHGDVSMVTGLLSTDFYWFSQSVYWKSQRVDVRVCLATDSFWLEEWVSVPRLYRSDVYVCSKSCRLCLTVVCWLLECNKVPSWIENPEYVTIFKTNAFTQCLFNTQLNIIFIFVHMSSLETFGLEFCKYSCYKFRPSCLILNSNKCTAQMMTLIIMQFYIKFCKYLLTTIGSLQRRYKFHCDH
jgi:hypothetical protein